MISSSEARSDLLTRYPGLRDDEPLEYCALCGHWHPKWNTAVVMGKSACLYCLGRR